MAYMEYTLSEQRWLRCSKISNLTIFSSTKIFPNPRDSPSEVLQYFSRVLTELQQIFHAVSINFSLNISKFALEFLQNVPRFFGYFLRFPEMITIFSFKLK